ncbi:hypothetical protein ACJIZ3_019744 [Penstemon smallii]|uniref:Uncharacterized protein n=1 Tax=Penstemon smallii TaxID=265156 RepID=A0ABD3T1Z6_9LAMI
MDKNPLVHSSKQGHGHVSIHMDISCDEKSYFSCSVVPCNLSQYSSYLAAKASATSGSVKRVVDEVFQATQTPSWLRAIIPAPVRLYSSKIAASKFTLITPAAGAVH